MERVNPEAPFYALSWQVLRINWELWLGCVLVLAVADIAIGQAEYALGAEAGAAGVLHLVQPVLYLLIDSFLAIALIRTVLTRGVLFGGRAVIDLGMRRFFLFLGAQMILLLLMVVLLAPWAVFAFTTVPADTGSDSYAGWAFYIILIVLLVYILIGLIGVDAVAQGRLSLGRALGWLRPHGLRLARLIVFGLGPVLILSFYLNGDFDPASYDEDLVVGTQALDLAEIAWHVLLATVELVGTVLVWVALAKVYLRAIPADEALEDARVAEVFK